MKRAILCIGLIGLVVSAGAQPLEIYSEIASCQYRSLVLNEETNTIDTLLITLHQDHTFRTKRTGTWNAIIMSGKWEQKRNRIILTNRHPYDQPLSVRVVPYTDSCNGYLPELIDSTGKIRKDFHLNIGHYTYNSDMKIPYTSLHDIRDSAYVCGTYGYYCSESFSIYYEDCYRIVIDMEFDPHWYNGAIREMLFRKKKGKLLLIKIVPSSR